MANSQSLLARLMNAPDLPAIVPRLQPEVLYRVIQTCGLEDCAEFVALATPAQLARVFDLDLWRARAPGADEQFDPDRFGVWLAVLLDAGPDVAAEKLAGLDIDLAAAGFAQHLVVMDHAAVAAYTTLDGEQVPGRDSKRSHASQVGGYVIETRRASAWDPILELLGFLAAERGEYFHRLMRRCVRLSNGPREEDASHSLLEDAEQHLFDLAREREARREHQGYATPAQAQAFLRTARDLKLDGDRPEPDAIARAYFRAFDPAVPETEPPGAQDANDAPLERVLDVLRDAGVLAAAPRALPGGGDPAAFRLAWIESHLSSHLDGAEELAYLANAIVAGCAVQGRAFTEREAGDAVVATCNLGLENWPPHWPDRDLVTAFQVGWTVLQRDVCIYASRRLIEVLSAVACSDRETHLRLGQLRFELIRRLVVREPWRARDSFDVLLAIDAPAWAALRGLIDECPVLHAAIGASNRRDRTISPTDFTFISGKGDVAAVRQFMESLPSAFT